MKELPLDNTFDHAKEVLDASEDIGGGGKKRWEKHFSRPLNTVHIPVEA